MSGFGVDFGQKVDLTASIRNILRNYPEGTAVLKELVQNADDAGASTVVFYLDYRTHSSAKLADQALHTFQGPSLLVYNDAIFTAEDFNSIQRIGDSLKKSSEDSRAKIGRFGIGFNAVYHWTDLPSFISSNYLVMLDPQARFLPNVNPSNPGKMVDFISNPGIVSQYPDQFKPYEIEGVTWNKTFKGTLFRLPLRTAEQAKTSLLSKRALSVQDAADLLEALKAEASAMLLFLKSVIKIEIREWRDPPGGAGSGAGASKVLFSCRATNSSADMMRKRCLVSDKPQLQLAASSIDYAMPADYTLTIECMSGATAAAGAVATVAGLTGHGSAPAVYTEQWEVCNQLGGRGANQIACEPENALLRLIPWAGVAACVSVTTAEGRSLTDVGSAGAHTAARDGLAYCFLPLPVRTGLPIMVNGFFELSSNRRDVWQAGADMTGDGRTRAQWNIALMKELIAPSYARLLVRLRDALGFSDQYQRLWPNIRATSAPWDEVVKSTLLLSRNVKLLKVTTPGELEILTSGAGAGVSKGPAVVAAGVGKSMAGWISCAEAVLLPVGMSLLHDGVTTAPGKDAHAHGGHADAAELAAYLVRAQAPLVLCTEVLKVTLVDTTTCALTATPTYVRQILRSGTQVSNNMRKIVAAHTIPTPEMCKYLLKYCFSDLTFTSGMSLTTATAAALDGLPILPMSNQTVTFLRIFTTSQVTAIGEVSSMGFSLSQAVCALSLVNFDTANACELLASEPAKISAAVADNNNSILLLLDEPQLKVFHRAAPVLLNKALIAPNEIDILSHAALGKLSNIRTFQAQFIPDLLRFIMPAECFNGSKTLRSQLKSDKFEEICAFLKVFWNYASTRPDVISAVKEGCSLVPARGLEALFPLSRLSNLLVSSKGDVTLPEPVVEILQLLGVQIVDALVLHENAMMPSVFWEYVLSPTRSGVLAAIESAVRSFSSTASAQQSTSAGKGAAAQDIFAQLTVEQRDLLRQYLATVEPVKNLTEKECTVVRGLPIFVSCKPVAQSSATGVGYVAIGDRYARANSPPRPAGSAPLHTTVADFKHLPDAILPEHLLKHAATHDLHLLTQLQVTVLTRTQYFKSEFLPSVQQLYALHSAETVATLLHMMDEIKSLSESDRGFTSMLGTVAFVPCAPGAVPAGGAAAPVRKLCKACELFDPTDAELVTLLDPQFFPDTSLFPLLQRPELLALLRSVGLQSSLNWPTIVACARSIADMSDRIPDASADPAIPRGTVPLVENTSKTARSRSLLRFLDRNIAKLMKDDKDKAADKKSTAPGHHSSASFPVFSFTSLFGGTAHSTPTKPSSTGTGGTKPDAARGGPEDTSQEQTMETCMEELKFISWVPVVVTALHDWMPWPEPSSKGGALSLTAAPLDTASVADALLVSATKRLVDEPVHTPALQRLLSWNEAVPVQVIAIQLREVSKRYVRLYGNLLEGTDGLDPDDKAGPPDEAALAKRREVQSIRETITGLIPQMYQRLNKAAAGDGTGTTSSTVQSILSLLESCAWIWVGDTFVTIDKVALNAGVNAAPYLYQLPQDLQVYSALLQAFQVKHHFNNRDYIEALRMMAVQSGAVAATLFPASSSKTTPDVSSGGRVLSDARLDVCISVATLLATESSASSSLHTASQAIYLPDNQGKLALAETLINDDVPWLSGPEYISVRAGCRLIHPNISSKVATTLGVKSLRLSLLNKTLEQNIFALPVEATVESFGQAESLTNRLKTILDMYPDGNPIFSELIQNADDAGASVVSILLDENTYSCESLLDSKMSALQGPSLVVRNNAMFTEADFKSLAKIGQGSKLDKLATTGRFGLGFNSTYHLTDTPSFVSGDHIVIFDPHCNYVPGATTNQPGVRIRFSGSSLSATFRNQFEPFEFFGCDLRSKFPGTLFRFPLRTATQARKSEISKRSYTVADMEQNLEQLGGQLSNMLIFLRNVRCIEVLRCVPGCKTPVLLHRAVSTVSNVETVNDQFLLTFFDKNDGNNGATSLSRDGFYKRLLATPDATLPRLFSQVHIETEAYAHEELESAVTGTLATTDSDAVVPAQAVTASVRVLGHAEVDYVVAAGLCGGDAKRMACLESLRHFKLVPMGAVAACINRHSSSDGTVAAAAGSTDGDTMYPLLQGVAFCYLPLPVLTQLPVHCNAYFELSSNRRDIWKGDDTKGEAKLRSDWNICIMKDVLAPLYAMLLSKMHARAQLAARKLSAASQLSIQQLQEQQQRLHYKLLSLLPCPLPHDPWNNVASALLANMQNEKLLYSELGGGSFVALRDAFVMERTITETADGAKDKLESLLLQENLAVVRTPEVVLKALSGSKAVAGEVNPALVRGLFHVSRAHTHATLGVANLPAKAALEHVLTATELENAVFWLQYCLRDISIPSGGAISSAVLDQLQQLVDLHLLPLDNGMLGTLRHLTDAPPYFLVNDTERRLLSRAGKQIVASEALLGQQVYTILKQDVFAQICNVRKITTVDTLKLISTILPGFWMAASTVFANRVAADTGTSRAASASPAESALIVSNEWLFSLWSYIVENKCMDMFREMFPILPVVYPNTLAEGKYLVKVSAAVPVLHMTYREISADAVGFLALLGVFIFDPAVLGGKSYSAEVMELLAPPSARGVMDALTLRVQALQKGGTSLQAFLSGASTAAQAAMQSFVLDSVVSKIDNLTGADITVLCALPIWSTFAPTGQAGAVSLRYAPLDTEVAKIPPMGSNGAGQDYLFDPTFVRLRDERDRPLYQKLGVREPSMGQFYASHIVQKFQSNSIPSEKMDALVVSILTNLPQLEKDSPGLTEKLSSCAIVRCEGENSGLYAPNALYDPQVPLLACFMPPRLFPSSTVYADPALMHSLRLLGLRTKVAADGVLTAARAIQSEFEQYLQRKGSAEQLNAINVRAAGLMSYLETHIDKILLEVSPATLHAFDQARTMRMEGDITGGSGDAAALQSPLGGEWGAELRATAWVPVYTSPPSRVVHADLALPWPARTHSAPIAAPSQCNSQKNIWLCSSSQRVCAVDTSKAEILEHVLGWDKPIPGRNVAGQLLALRQTHDAVADKVSFSAHSANEIYQEIVPTLLQHLQLAYSRESPAEVKLWVDALRGKAVIWMQSRFVETTRLAFTALTNLDTEPFLFIVRPELVKFKKLLLELGAREAFEATDLAVLTRDLYASHRDTPLSTYKATLCVGIVQLLYKLISGEDVSADMKDSAAAGSPAADADLPVAQPVSADGTVLSSDQKERPAEKTTADSEKVVIKPKKVSLAELGVIYLPDELNFLQASTVLTFDDAPWMSQALHLQQQQQAAPGSGNSGALRFVHPRIESAVAMALGCKSLREQLFAGEDVHCPDADMLHSALDDDSLRDTLVDLLYVADACGANKLHIVYDDRMHPHESVLHPGLSETQGPALVAYLEGGAFVDRETMSLLLSLQNLNNDALSGAEVHSPNSGSSANSAAYSARAKFRRATGKKLLTTFAVTDCLQVLSGNEFFVFDPCGKFLHSGPTSQAEAEKSQANKDGGMKRLQSKLQRKSTAELLPRAASTPRAQHYVITKASRGGLGGGSTGSGSNALERFPDQFAPFLSLPFQFREQLQRSGRVNGVVLRMPLRAGASVISRHITTVDDIKTQFGSLRSLAAPALVFADTLMEVSVSHWDGAVRMAAETAGDKGSAAKDAAPTSEEAAASSSQILCDLSIKLVSPVSTRRSRHSITADKGWNKQGFSKLFAKAFVPPEIMYTVAIDTTVRCREAWISPTPQLASVMALLISQPTINTTAMKTHREDWLVTAINGYGRLRDLAVTDPYLTMEMQPFVTLAVPILDAALLMDIAVPPEPGMYFNAAAAVATTGLPFYIEGSFLQVHSPPATTMARSNSVKGVSFAGEGARSSPAYSPADLQVCQAWTEALMYIAFDILYPKALFEIKARIESIAKNLTTVSGAQSNSSSARKLRLLSGFYKYFPYSPRTSSVANKVLATTSVWSNFVQNPLFLQQGGFQYLHESMLPTKLLPADVLTYILPILPLAFCPQQLTVDLHNAKVGHVSSLSPAKLRQTMSNNALMHCSRLTNNPLLVRALLQYVLEDIAERSASEGEYSKRKLFREMAGVPLMPMATLNVKTFPRNASEQVAIAPVIMHALLPGLNNSFLHPTLTSSIALFSDAIFLDTLFISPFNASYLERNIASVIPGSWRLVPAIDWSETASAGNTVGGAGRALRPTGPGAEATAAPSPLLLYTLWNTVLSAETSWLEIEKLKDYPLVPVVSRGRRLLLSMSLLSVVFSLQSTEEQDAQRVYLKRELGRMTQLAASTQDALPEGTAEAVADEWAWTTQPLSSSSAKARNVVRQAQDNVTARAAVAAARTDDSDDDIGDGVITDLDFPGEPSPTVVLPASPTGPVPMAPANRAGGPAEPAAAAGDAAPRVAATPANAPPVMSVLTILQTLGVPFLDAGIFESIPVIINRPDTTSLTSTSGSATDFRGRHILQALHKLDSMHITLPRGGDATDSGSADPVPLLRYDDLSVTDRTTLLVLMSSQLHQNMAPLSQQEQTQIKQLRLFTSKADNSAVAIADCQNGVYWCREESVLETINNRSTTTSNQAAPVVLVHDAALRDLYTLLGVEELTAATAVRKFTVPQLRTMAPLPRLKVMMSLAAQWDSYRGDEPLVKLLKNVPFVPLHAPQASAESASAASAVLMQSTGPAVQSATWETLESCEGMDASSLRLAKDLFLWTNDELLAALRGSKQGVYFPPAYLRTAAMHVMCQDLGMQADLSEASFSRIAADIEVSLNNAYAGSNSTEAQLDALREAAERGRGLLRYVKANDRISLLLQNKTVAAAIGKIRFVPMRIPVSTEPGGYVTYRDDVGRFDMLLARTHGMLAFTVLPIIDEDIVPPQYFYSSLGITNSPPAEVVLRHVRNLTSQGESLDRWNAPYEIAKTFSAIFQYLQDNWKSLSPNVKTSLSNINLIPVGNMLIKPTRLFFRLAEDLSPFMHEIPRLYGAHEAFLKQIGIKETPSVQDYVRFLGDLASECGECFLNPNELRAVVAILQVIALQCGESAEAADASGAISADANSQGKMTALEVKTVAPSTDISQLYVPDERSVMRPVAQCLLNDNEWYRGNRGVQQQLQQAGLYLLHPSISVQTAALLGMERLTGVVSEELVAAPQDVSQDVLRGEQAQLQDRYHAAVVAPTFIAALSTLLLSKQSTEHSDASAAASLRTPSALTALFQSLQFQFVRSLRTRFVLSGGVDADRDDGAAGERLSFLHKQSNDGGTLYVNLSLAGPPLTISLAVAVGLCQCVGADLSLSYAIAALLDAQDVPHLQLVLESLHVHHSDSNSAGSGETGLHATAHHSRGVPGERVSAEDSTLLELHPQRAFRVGEVVAIEEADMDVTDGSVPVSGVKASAPDALPANMKVKMKTYAKVISVGAASDEGIRRISIKIGSGVRQVLSTDLFSFRSARESNTAKAASTTLKVPAKSIFNFGRKPAAPATGGVANAKAPGASDTTATSTGTAGGDAAAAEISQAELLGAVNGLLARAGVPMDMEQQSMVAHILELESSKKRMEKELLAERQQLMQCRDQLEASSNMLKCSICITNDVYYVITPCGHTICESCIDMWRGSGCPTCRTRMQAKVRFFLPGSSANA